MQIIQHGIVLWHGTKVVCHTKCVRIWKTFPKFTGIKRKWLFVSFMQHKDSKGKCVTLVVHKSGKHSLNSLSSEGDIFPVLQRHHQ